MKLQFVLSLLILVTGINWSSRTLAHGVLMEATPIPSFQVQVTYESGEPMANAQINVYAPTDPQNVWLQTLTNENGYFLFTPDPNIPGTWDIQARLAGHGELLRINVQEDGAIRQLSRSDNTPLQKWLTIAAVVWGFVGTALFFSRRQQPLQTTATPEHSHF
ncbi:MAG: carboxypeptidase-like regulatory domain-containing protein [Cyanobacteria bacterium P01_F01_bin.150]